MFKIFFFPHFHYDVVWKFNRKDYSYINRRILEQAVKLCQKYPNFKFGIEDVYQLIEIEKEDPNLWQALREEIKRGKIEIIDGEYLMADTYLAGGEVFARNIFYGKQYVKEKFNQEVKVGWITDSFGLNPQIPQIYKDAGFRWLAFGRGYKVQPKSSEFWWRGIDGTKILTHYFSSSHSYHVGIFFLYFKENIRELKKFAATKNILMPCGIGSCYFPTLIFKKIKDWNKAYPQEKIKITSPQNFFEAVEKEGQKLKVKSEEMYSGNRIFTGVLTSRIWLKISYHQVKNLILFAERFATLASGLGKEYPREKFKESWEKIFFLAFHDVLPGTSIDEVFNEVREMIKKLESDLTFISKESLNYILKEIDLNQKGLIIFNPTGDELETYLEKEIKIEDKIKSLKLGGTEFEVLDEKRDKMNHLRQAKIGFLAKIPPLGYKFYPLSFSQESKKKNKIGQGGDSIENSKFRVRVNKLNGICEIFEEGKRILIGNKLELENEVGSIYTHRDISKSLMEEKHRIGLIGEEGKRHGTLPAFKIEDYQIERRKLFQKIILKESLFGTFWPYRLLDYFPCEFYRQKLLEIEKEVKIYKNLPWIEFKTKIKNNFPQIRLRARFDLDFPGEYWVGVPFGVLKGKRELPFDYPMENWIEYGNKSYGMTLITKGISGHQISKNIIYLTLLRSINLLSHGDKGPIIPVPDALEVGKEFEFNYAIFPHQGSWLDAKVWKVASNFIVSPQVLETEGKEGKSPLEKSFLSLPENLVLTCLKPSQDPNSKDVVLRFYETAGKKTKLDLKIFKGVRKVLLTNLIETKEQELKDFLIVHPFKIITLKLKF